MSKKSKKIAAEAPLSKKERRALEAREAELRAELERRALKKAAKKKAAAKGKSKADKPAKKKGKPQRAEPIEITATAEAPVQTAAEVTERAKPLSGDEMKAALKADTDAARSNVTEMDAAIKARVHARRESRERLAAMQSDVAAGKKARKAKADNVTPLEVAVAAFDEAAEGAEPAAQIAEVVETERGREIVVGTTGAASTDADFAKPSEAPRVDFEQNGNGQYIVKRPTDGKLVGYTRVTTYIACLEDTTKLTEWKMRLLLEGVAAAEEKGDVDASVTGKIRELMHVRDVAIKKARKADKRGDLDLGDLAKLTERAWYEFKIEINKLADDLFEIGGGREKAQKGTDLHALCDIYDREGIDRIGEMLTEGEITPADLADVEAYADAVKRLGVKFIDIERVVVNDDLKVAGRLDRTGMVKLPGEARARRRVLDLKTGRIDYGAGKIAQQIEMYAGAQGYDLDTHEREDLKLDRTKGIVIHLPAGSGRATIHVVDLVLGRKGNRLAAEVRAWRNEGKRAIDHKSDVLAELATLEAEAAS